MMQDRLMLLCAGLLLPLLGGCDDVSQYDAHTGERAETGAATTDTPADTGMPAEADDEPQVEASGANWEIAISGPGIDLPAVSGRVVMAMNMPGGIATYRFTSATLMGAIDLRDVRVGEPGVFKPYNVQLNWLQEQVTCGMSSLNPGQRLEVEIQATPSGYRGTFAGGVECVPVHGGERKAAQVEGWFEK